jgi:hypothetical protein
MQPLSFRQQGACAFKVVEEMFLVARRFDPHSKFTMEGGVADPTANLAKAQAYYSKKHPG